VLSARPSPPIYRDFTDLLLFAHDAFLVITLLLWGVSLRLQSKRICVGQLPLWVPMLCLTAIGALSAFTAIDRGLSAYCVLHLLLLLLLYLFMVSEISYLSSIMWAFAAQLLIQSVVAIGQVIQQSDMGLSKLGEHALDPVSGSAMVWGEGGLASLRSYGLSDHPNILAINLVLGLLIVTSWYVSSAGPRQIPVLVIICLASVALIMTFSQSAWTALAAGGFTMASLCIQLRPQLRIRNWASLVGASLLVTLPVVWFSLPYLSLGTSDAVITARVQERLTARTERETVSRVANELFVSNPFDGVGLGTLPLAIQEHYSEFDYDFQPARMTLLNAAVETGLFGAMFYLMLLISPWVMMWLTRDRLQWSYELIGVSAALLAISVFNLLDAYSWSYHSGRLWQWIVWGMWASSYRASRASGAGTVVTASIGESDV
jgi:O-antigen ligase